MSEEEQITSIMPRLEQGRGLVWIFIDAIMYRTAFLIENHAILKDQLT